jgi:hypothetical protein
LVPSEPNEDAMIHLPWEVAATLAIPPDRGI